MTFGGPGLTTQLTAIGTYTQGSHPSTTRDITDSVTWTSSTPECVTVNSTGLITSGSNICSNILVTASAPGFTGIITGSMTVNVTGSGGAAEPITALTITPSTDSVALAGQTGQFIALGTSGTTGLPTNMTTLVAWSSSNAGVATIGANTGLATAVGQGTTQITALYTNPDKSVVAATATFVVTGSASEPLQSIAITPATQSILAGQTSQLIAIGTFSPTAPTPGTQNLTATVAWTSSNTSIASVTNPGGLVTAVGPGTAVITAIAANPDKSVVTATATVTVTGGSSSSEPYVSLAIIPAAQTLTSAGQIAKYIAIGTTSSGTTVDLTSQTNTIWSTSSPQVTTPYIPSGQTTAVPGEFTTVGNGAAAITATYTITPATATSPAIVVSGSAALTVAITPTPEPLLSTAIYPSSPSVASPGLTSQLADIGTFSAAPITQDVTAGIASEKITTSWSSSTLTVATVTTVCPTGLSALSCTISACPGTSNAGVCTSCPGGTVASGASCATLNPTTPVGLVTGLSQGTTAIMAVSSNPDGSQVIASVPFSVTGGSTEQITGLTIIPAVISATSPAQQNQLLAQGTEGALQYDVTSQVVWKSNTSTVASICTAGDPLPCTPATDGLVTAATAGTTIITATWTNLDKSEVVAQATYTVAIGASPEPLISINVVPVNITVSNKGMTQQYLAFGTFTTIPTLRDITDSVTWITLTPNLVSINSAGTPGEPAGLATAMGYEGLGVIYAEGTNPDNTVVLSNPVSFSCQEPGISPPVCDQSVAPALLATLTVFNAGSNDTNWLITAPSDTGVPNLIHCGPGSEIDGLGNSVCTGTYAAGTDVTITASLAGGALDNTFGGWTANCDNSIPPIYTPNMTNTCTLPNLSNPSGLVGNQSVGALFYGLTLNCSTVTSGTVGVAFNSGAITVSNGTPPDTFSVVGTLPAGLTLNTSTGAVTGTPTASGSFSLSATDAHGITAASTCAITIAQ
jgi:hypothetical protein